MAKDSLRAQDEYVRKRDEVKQEGEEIYEQLLEIIVESSSKDEIVDRIFALPRAKQLFIAMRNTNRFFRRYANSESRRRKNISKLYPPDIPSSDDLHHS